MGAGPGGAREGWAREDLWPEGGTLVPLRGASYDRQGQRMESVLLEDVQLDPDFPADHFDP